MMKNTLTRCAFAAATLAMAGAFVAGCGGNNNPPYPSAPTDSRPMTPPSVVPPGARQLSTGTYNQITFTIPDRPGVLYIVDLTDGQKVVGMTNSVQSMAGKTMTMADLKNTTQGLDMNHLYSVYYAEPEPTTKPIGGMTPPM